MILPFLLALLAFVRAAADPGAAVAPGRTAPARASFDQAVYRDQLHELDRDITRGRDHPNRGRRRSAGNPAPPACHRQTAGRAARLSRSPVLAAIVFVVVAGGSVSGYLWLGAPGLPDEPFSARTAELARDHGASSLQQAADKLAAKLKQNPSDASGWLLYGRTPGDAEPVGRSRGRLPPRHCPGPEQPRRARRSCRGHGDAGRRHGDPGGRGGVPAGAEERSGQRGRTLLSCTRRHAGGEPRKAIDGWQALLADTSGEFAVAGAAWAEDRRGGTGGGHPGAGTGERDAAGPGFEAQAAGPGRQGDGRAANMPDDQRQAMIRGMVAKLAAEQEANPSNLDGWMRLGRAYAVLHEPDKAADAFEKAAALKPDDVSIPLQEVRALLSDHAPAEKLPPRVGRSAETGRSQGSGAAFGVVVSGHRGGAGCAPG